MRFDVSVSTTAALLQADSTCSDGELLTGEELSLPLPPLAELTKRVVMELESVDIKS